jgi:TPP-dependent indolepyruvate ferredoxin oxidoreductase alpha subunit
LGSSLRAVLKRTLILLVLVLALVVSACGGGQPETCEGIADVTIDLMQDLIDNVEEEVGDMTVEELVAAQGDLPSVEQFQKEATKINEQALELECSQATIESLVAERDHQLEATTPIGQFMIDAIRSGGL